MTVNEITSSVINDTKVDSNSKVASTSNSKTDFDTYMNKTYSYEDIINMASKTYNVPTDLIKAVIMTESSFNNDSVSYCGATGLMQLMPVAAKELGVTDATDPIQNVMGGTKLLAKFLNKYNGDLSLTLAAYNGGPGNVSKYDGVPPFCEKYVERVTGFMKSGVKVPEKYVTVNVTNGTSSVAASSTSAAAPVKASASPTVTSTVGVSATSNTATNATDKAASNTISDTVSDTVSTTTSNTVSNTASDTSVASTNNVNNMATYVPNDDKEIEYSEADSYLTSALKLQMLQAFRNYSDYMRVLDLISDNSIIPSEDDNKSANNNNESNNII